MRAAISPDRAPAQPGRGQLLLQGWQHSLRHGAPASLRPRRRSLSGTRSSSGDGAVHAGKFPGPAARAEGHTPSP